MTSENFGRAALAVSIAALSLLIAPTATPQLRPKVKVLTNPATSVPPECAEGTATPIPRTTVDVTPAPAPQPVREATAVRGTLSTSLRAVQAAAQRDDYATFKRALADARAAAAAAERGGERDAADEVLRVDRDLERVWDFAMTDPSGAFFGAENRELADIARTYGASDAVVHVSGRALYATSELRRAITAEASRRLTRLGIHVATPQTTTARAVTMRPSRSVVDVTRRVPSRTTREVAEVTESRPRTRHRARTHSRPRTRTHGARASAADVAAGSMAAPKTTPATASTKTTAPAPAAPRSTTAAAPPTTTVAQTGGSTPAPATPAPTHTAAPAATHTTAATPTGGSTPAPATPAPTHTAAATSSSPTPSAPAVVTTSSTAATEAAAPTTTAESPTSTSTATGSTSTTATTATATSMNNTGATATSDTAVTDTTASAPAAPRQAPAPGGSMNMIFRILVVLIAVAALIVLIRKSS